MLRKAMSAQSPVRSIVWLVELTVVGTESIQLIILRFQQLGNAARLW